MNDWTIELSDDLICVLDRDMVYLVGPGSVRLRLSKTDGSALRCFLRDERPLCSSDFCRTSASLRNLVSSINKSARNVGFDGKLLKPVGDGHPGFYLLDEDLANSESLREYRKLFKKVNEGQEASALQDHRVPLSSHFEKEALRFQFGRMVPDGGRGRRHADNIIARCAAVAAIEEMIESRKRGESVVLVTGQMGTGKTEIMAQLNTAFTLFCETNGDISSSGDLLNQMVLFSTKYIEGFGCPTGEFVWTDHAAYYKHYLFEPLSFSARNDPIVIGVDGIDELCDPQEFIRIVRSSSRSNLFRNITLVVSCQPEPRILEEIANGIPFARRYDVGEDGTVDQCIESFCREAGIEDGMISRVAALSDGLFAIASLLCSELLELDDSEKREDALTAYEDDAASSGRIDSFFKNALEIRKERLCRGADREKWDDVRRAIGILALAGRIPVEILEKALSWNVDSMHPCIEPTFEIDQIVASLGSLVVLSDSFGTSYLAPYRKSFGEWIAGEFRSGDSAYARSKGCSERLAAACLQVIKERCPSDCRAPDCSDGSVRFAAENILRLSGRSEHEAYRSIVDDPRYYTAIAACNVEMAEELILRADFESAKLRLRDALESLRKAEASGSEISVAYLRLLGLLHATSKYAECIEMCVEAGEVLGGCVFDSEAGRQKAIAEVLTYRARALARQNLWRQSADYFHEAQSILESIGDRLQETEALLYEMNSFRIRSSDASIGIADTIDELWPNGICEIRDYSLPTYVRVLVDEATCLQAISGQAERANDLIDKALEIIDSDNGPSAVPSAYCVEALRAKTLIAYTLGKERRNAGLLKEGLKYGRRAVGEARKLFGALSHQYAASLNALGWINIRLDRQETALRQFKESYDIECALDGPVSFPAAISLRNQAQAKLGIASKLPPHKRNKSICDARRYYEEGLEILDQILGGQNGEELTWRKRFETELEGVSEEVEELARRREAPVG